MEKKSKPATTAAEQIQRKSWTRRLMEYVFDTTDQKSIHPNSKIFFVPFCVNFSPGQSFMGRLYQPSIIKDPTIEVDTVVFANLRRVYYEAIHPWNRWTVHTRLMVRAAQRARRTIILKQCLTTVSNFQFFIWYWVLGPLYCALSFWDLKEIMETKVSSRFRLH